MRKCSGSLECFLTNNFMEGARVGSLTRFESKRDS